MNKILSVVEKGGVAMGGVMGGVNSPYTGRQVIQLSGVSVLSVEQEREEGGMLPLLRRKSLGSRVILSLSLKKKKKHNTNAKD